MAAFASSPVDGLELRQRIETITAAKHAVGGRRLKPEEIDAVLPREEPKVPGPEAARLSRWRPHKTGVVTSGMQAALDAANAIAASGQRVTLLAVAKALGLRGADSVSLRVHRLREMGLWPWPRGTPWGTRRHEG